MIAVLSQPSRDLHITVQSASGFSFTRVVRLAVAVDASTRVRVQMSEGRVVLSLRVLEAVLNKIVSTCKGQEGCLRQAIIARCGEAWVGERCDEACLRNGLRKCQGEGGIGALVSRFAEILLWVGCVGILLVFSSGVVLALAAGTGKVVRGVAGAVGIKEKLGLCWSWAMKIRDRMCDCIDMALHQIRPQSPRTSH